jgi:rfaE bifunctional protein kinase chain/domain
MENLINEFEGKRVLIVGDVMIDAYIMGKVERISPEAPVPVVNIDQRDMRLGGAANVAINIIALKAIPILCSVIGKDDDGDALVTLMQNSKMPTAGIVQSKNRKTTTKTRIIGNKHQLLRMDQEMLSDINDSENDKLIKAFTAHIKKCDVVVLEDYNKGVLTEKNIPVLIDIAIKAGKPIAVDPKKKNFLAYKNVTLFKPNLKEIKEGLNSDLNLKKKENLVDLVLELNEKLNNTYTMVTLSEDGVMVTDHSDFNFIPAHLRNISDVSGAGDTVISVASLCLACKVEMGIVAELSNLAGGLVCEESGVVPINIEKLKKESSYLI